jgi:cobalt-zinc-cadmium efflux system outer membrane protein
MKVLIGVRTQARSCLLALGMAFACGNAVAQEPVPGGSLHSLLAYARQHNPEFAAMRHDAEAVLQRIELAGALPDPVLRIELENINNYSVGMNGVASDTPASILPARVGETKYNLIQAFPFWGKRDLKREVAEADAELANSGAAKTWNELAAKVKAVYAQYYYVAGNITLTSELLDLMTQLEAVARARYASGLALQQDVIRAQIDQTGMRGELIGLNNEKRQLQARLNALLARKATAPLAEPQGLRPLPLPAALDYSALESRVLERNPQLQGDNARLRGAGKSRELTYRNRYPDFSVGVTPVQMGNRVESWNLMLEMNIPLQQGSRRAQEREAEAMWSSAQARQQATANQLLADLSENLAGIEAARQMEQLINAGYMPQAEAGFQSALTAYENGRADFATLLDAQRQIRKARQDSLKAQTEAQIRLAEIERLVGEEL